VQPITLLLPIRNGAIFVDDIMKSMISNCQPLDEIIVINDGSTDESLNLLENWASRESQVKIISTKGVGLVKSLNLGFSESRNNWVARFDADDHYEINRLEKQRKFINENVSVIFADYSMYLDGKKFAGEIPSPVFHEATLLSLLYSQQTPHPVSLINKEKFVKSGGYLEDEFPAEDLGLWVRMSLHGELISCPENLFSYRLSKTSISAQRRQEALQKKNEIIKTVLPILKEKYSSRNSALKNFNSLSGLPNEVVRKILYIRNLRLLKSMTGLKRDDSGKRVPNFYWYLFIHPTKVISFLFFQIIRKRFRAES
jgi:glycosyltransferase involved in cell wall biosynthesis